MFVNREREVLQLDRFWAGSAGGLGIVWGRRRVGKTALIERFAAERPTIFHFGATGDA